MGHQLVSDYNGTSLIKMGNGKSYIVEQIILLVIIVIIIVVCIWAYGTAEAPKRSDRSPSNTSKISVETDYDHTPKDPEPLMIGNNRWYYILFRKGIHDEKTIVSLNQEGSRIAAEVVQYRNGAVTKRYTANQKFENRPNYIFENQDLEVGIKDQEFYLYFRDLDFESKAGLAGQELGPNVHLTFLDQDPKYWCYIIYSQNGEAGSAFSGTVTTDKQGGILISDQMGRLILDMSTDAGSHKTIIWSSDHKN